MEHRDPEIQDQAEAPGGAMERPGAGPPAAFDPEAYARDRARLRAGFWRKVRGTLGRVPFLEDAVAGYYCLLDPATPRRVKAVVAAALAYFVVPTDMIPDFIAGLGFGDDATVLYAALSSVAAHVTDSHRAAARAALARLRREDESAGPA